MANIMTYSAKYKEIVKKPGKPRILRWLTCCNKKNISKCLVKGLNIEEYNNSEIVMVNLVKVFYLLKRNIYRDSYNITVLLPKQVYWQMFFFRNYQLQDSPNTSFL